MLCIYDSSIHIADVLVAAVKQSDGIESICQNVSLQLSDGIPDVVIIAGEINNPALIGGISSHLSKMASSTSQIFVPGMPAVDFDTEVMFSELTKKSGVYVLRGDTIDIEGVAYAGWILHEHADRLSQMMHVRWLKRVANELNGKPHMIIPNVINISVKSAV